jgi:hypothetical protein
MLLKRIFVNQQQRTLVIRNGQLQAILRPGTHLLFVPPFAKIEAEFHNLHKLVFRSRWVEPLLRLRPDLVSEHFEVIRPSEFEIAMVSVDGQLYQVVLPARRLVLWKEGADIQVEFVSLVEGPAISESILDGFERKTRKRAPVFDSWDDSTSGTLIERLLEEGSTSGRTES